MPVLGPLANPPASPLPGWSLRGHQASAAVRAGPPTASTPSLSSRPSGRVPRCDRPARARLAGCACCTPTPAGAAQGCFPGSIFDIENARCGHPGALARRAHRFPSVPRATPDCVVAGGPERVRRGARRLAVAPSKCARTGHRSMTILAFRPSQLARLADGVTLPPSRVAQDSTCPRDTANLPGETGPGARSGRGGDGDHGGAVVGGLKTDRWAGDDQRCRVVRAAPAARTACVIGVTDRCRRVQGRVLPGMTSHAQAA